MRPITNPLLQQNNNNNYPCLSAAGPWPLPLKSPRPTLPLSTRPELGLTGLPLIRGLRAWALCSKSRHRPGGSLGQAPVSCPRPADVHLSAEWGLALGLDARRAGIGALVATLQSSEGSSRTQTQSLFLRTAQAPTPQPGGMLRGWLRNRTGGAQTQPPHTAASRARERSGRRWRKSVSHTTGRDKPHTRQNRLDQPRLKHPGEKESREGLREELSEILGKDCCEEQSEELRKDRSEEIREKLNEEPKLKAVQCEEFRGKSREDFREQVSVESKGECREELSEEPKPKVERSKEPRDEPRLKQSEEFRGKPREDFREQLSGEINEEPTTERSEELQVEFKPEQSGELKEKSRNEFKGEYSEEPSEDLIIEPGVNLREEPRAQPREELIEELIEEPREALVEEPREVSKELKMDSKDYECLLNKPVEFCTFLKEESSLKMHTQTLPSEELHYSTSTAVPSTAPTTTSNPISTFPPTFSLTPTIAPTSTPSSAHTPIPTFATAPSKQLQNSTRAEPQAETTGVFLHGEKSNDTEDLVCAHWDSAWSQTCIVSSSPQGGSTCKSSIEGVDPLTVSWNSPGSKERTSQGEGNRNSTEDRPFPEFDLLKGGAQRNCSLDSDREDPTEELEFGGFIQAPSAYSSECSNQVWSNDSGGTGWDQSDSSWAVFPADETEQTEDYGGQWWSLSSVEDMVPTQGASESQVSVFTTAFPSSVDHSRCEPMAFPSPSDSTVPTLTQLLRRSVVHEEGRPAIRLLDPFHDLNRMIDRRVSGVSQERLQWSLGLTPLPPETGARPTHRRLSLGHTSCPFSCPI